LAARTKLETFGVDLGQHRFEVARRGGQGVWWVGRVGEGFSLSVERRDALILAR
jgi:hypothetical protein